MSVDLELWTRETGELRALLPRAGEWEAEGDLYELGGDGWLVSVFEPEDAPDEVPAELAALVEVETLGAELGGAGLDPESGRPTSWAA